MERENKLSAEVSNKNIEPISFFNENEGFVLAYKKTEKLASAVYMVTSLFSNDEPMKWTLRKKVADVLSFILKYKDIPEGGSNDFIYEAKTKTLELISLLEISLRGGLVSQMNFSILKTEFLNLITLLNSYSSNTYFPSANEISKKYFDEFSPVTGYSNLHTKTKELSKSNDSQQMSLSNIKDRGIISSQENEKKTNRQNIILSLIRKKKELTIKDIAVVIKDCSEKTIQRELNSFISAGILKRAGVRRWSRYSLV